MMYILEFSMVSTFFKTKKKKHGLYLWQLLQLKWSFYNYEFCENQIYYVVIEREIFDGGENKIK